MKHKPAGEHQSLIVVNDENEWGFKKVLNPVLIQGRPLENIYTTCFFFIKKKVNKQIKRLKIYAQWIEIRNLSLIIDIICLIASGFVSTPKQRACLKTLREPIVKNTNKNENRQWDSDLIGSTETVWGKVKCQSVKNTLQPVLTSPKLFIIYILA